MFASYSPYGGNGNRSTVEKWHMVHRKLQCSVTSRARIRGRREEVTGHR
jgi:hypothetical protein